MSKFQVLMVFRDVTGVLMLMLVLVLVLVLKSLHLVYVVEG